MLKIITFVQLTAKNAKGKIKRLTPYQFQSKLAIIFPWERIGFASAPDIIPVVYKIGTGRGFNASTLKT